MSRKAMIAKKSCPNRFFKKQFVNENHTDWDKHLQYVMIAYHSTEHETTCLTPYTCMLGQETTCPFELMFEMPQVINIPANEWVWQLQEKIEAVHRFVRENKDRSMHSRKYIMMKTFHMRRLR